MSEFVSEFVSDRENLDSYRRMSRKTLKANSKIAFPTSYKNTSCQFIDRIHSGNVRNIDFSECGFNNCIFHDVVNMSLCLFDDLKFIKNHFGNCKFIGVDFNSCNFTDSVFDNCAFYKCTFILCNFTNVNFNRCEFTDTIVRISTTKETIFNLCIYESNFPHCIKYCGASAKFIEQIQI